MTEGLCLSTWIQLYLKMANHLADLQVTWARWQPRGVRGGRLYCANRSVLPNISNVLSLLHLSKKAKFMARLTSKLEDKRLLSHQTQIWLLCPPVSREQVGTDPAPEYQGTEFQICCGHHVPRQRLHRKTL